ncbi:MAG: universal stress protein [Leucobacter sp.]
MSAKYLIGVDASNHSRAALAWGLKRASERGASVELLHVADDSFLSESVAFLSEAQNASEQMLANEIEYARTTLGFAGNITGTAVVGHPIAEVELASKNSDLLILGAHSGSRFAGSVFGTRAVKIAAVAHCPVAVIPAEQENTGEGIVVGVDGSESSKLALAFAANEAAHNGKPLIAVYAWMPPLTPGLEYLWSEELVTAQQSAAEEAIAIAVAGLASRYPDLEVRREIVQAPPVTALLQVAEHAEMVVVGSRGRGGISRLLLGSVSHGILSQLPCTTVVTRAE